MARIAIIGGGVAGCATALELAKYGHEVVVLEQNKDILSGTSAKTPGRMGLGYHYYDLETAIFYMEQTIAFMKRYPDCFLGDEIKESYLLHGRYFIVKDSLIAPKDLIATHDKILSRFKDMCLSDKSNNIFNTVFLHRDLDLQEYKNDVNTKIITLAIETKERLLDWQKFGRYLRQELADYQSIKIKVNFKVSDLSYGNNGSFILSDGLRSQEVDYVVNCAWQNIEFLNEKFGIRSDFEGDAKLPMTLRLKLLAEVELPESLKKKHSMFFCVGAHAMFSNLGNGIARITYADVTNHFVTTKNYMPEKYEKWLSDGLNKEEEREYGEKIIKGVSKYIPEMAKAKLRKIMPGIVKSKGAFELRNKDSSFHKRNYSGVEERQIGWIDNASMKLFYCFGNAMEVAKIISKQENRN